MQAARTPLGTSNHANTMLPIEAVLGNLCQRAGLPPSAGIDGLLRLAARGGALSPIAGPGSGSNGSGASSSSAVSGRAPVDGKLRNCDHDLVFEELHACSKYLVFQRGGYIHAPALQQET